MTDRFKHFVDLFLTNKTLYEYLVIRTGVQTLDWSYPDSVVNTANAAIMEALTQNMPKAAVRPLMDSMISATGAILTHAAKETLSGTPLEVLAIISPQQVAAVWNSNFLQHWLSVEEEYKTHPERFVESSNDDVSMGEIVVNPGLGQTTADKKKGVDNSTPSDTSYAALVKKQKLEQTVLPWWTEFESDTDKKVAESFSLSLKTLKTTVLGTGTSNEIRIPQNFDKAFSEAYKLIVVLAKELGLEIKTSSVVLTAEMTWIPLLNKANPNLEELKKLDPKGDICGAFIAFNEALDFLMSPTINTDQSAGLNYMKYLLAAGSQTSFNSSPTKYEMTYIFGSNTKTEFEQKIRPLFPMIGEFSSIMSNLLQSIVSFMMSTLRGQHFCTRYEKVLVSLFKKDSTIFSQTFNKVQRQRLTEEGKKVVARKQKPNNNHYERYVAVIKPKIETKQVPVSATEMSIIKTVNLELQHLEEKVPLRVNINQSVRKEQANLIVQTLHEKCKSINNIVMRRKTVAYKKLVENRNKILNDPNVSEVEKTQLKAENFTTDQWREVITPIIESDKSVLLTIQNELCIDINSGKIRWSDLTNALNIRI
jgi:hypothetical protein